jgi:signal transduction histidine kinase
MTMNVEFLKQIPIFAGLHAEDLQRLIEMSDTITVSDGTWFMREGEPGDAFYVILDGEVEISKRSGQQTIVLSVRGAGNMLGELSLLEDTPRTASVRARCEVTLLKIRRENFLQLLHDSPTAAQAVLHTVSERLRHTETLLRHSEKMAALGTLAAGLAHELNNPSAAMQRAASQLQTAVNDWVRAATDLNRLTFTAEQTLRLNDLRGELIDRAGQAGDLDPLTRSDREYEAQTWLEDHQIDQAWELAPALVTLGWGVDRLAQLDQTFSRDQAAAVVHWLAHGCAVYALLGDIGLSAQRISEIVKAVKDYSYLDQAPVQAVDVHEGLENTLVMLRHKLKHGVRIRREYAPDLPRIEAHGGELNQVWTNLIDNAIYAMQGQGDLSLRTSARDGFIEVEVGDTGHGIPPEIQARIFEPFFTTKPPGSGTGLGLNITYNIVTQQHGGEVRVESRPGATRFIVTLPIKLKSDAPGGGRVPPQ